MLLTKKRSLARAASTCFVAPLSTTFNASRQSDGGRGARGEWFVGAAGTRARAAVGVARPRPHMVPRPAPARGNERPPPFFHARAAPRRAVEGLVGGDHFQSRLSRRPLELR